MNAVVINDCEELIKRLGFKLETFKNSTVLISGGNSMLGKALINLFCYLNKHYEYRITIFNLVRNLEKTQKIFEEWIDQEFFHIIHQDVCDPIDVAQYEDLRNVEYIFHFAGSASARLIAEDPTGIIKANTLGTINLLDFAHSIHAKNVIFSSTREIYGGMLRDDWIKETDMGVLDPSIPRNAYPTSKRLAEALFVAYAKQFGVPYTILRMAHIYGPGMEIDNDGRVMADIVGSVVRRKNIVLYSDGTAMRSFCYLTDCVDGILRALLSNAESRFFNLSNEIEPIMIKEAAQMAVASFPERSLKVLFSHDESANYQGGYNPLPLIPLETGKLESYGWKPCVTLQEGMKRTIESFS